MSKVVPSQVVDLIAIRYPQADENPLFNIPSVDAAILATIINLVDEIPAELLTLQGEAYTDLVFGLEAMGSVIERWSIRITAM